MQGHIVLNPHLGSACLQKLFGLSSSLACLLAVSIERRHTIEGALFRIVVEVSRQEHFHARKVLQAASKRVQQWAVDSEVVRIAVNIGDGLAERHHFSTYLLEEFFE